MPPFHFFEQSPALLWVFYEITARLLPTPPPPPTTFSVEFSQSVSLGCQPASQPANSSWNPLHRFKANRSKYVPKYVRTRRVAQK